jgi:hypothetical protein
MVAQARRLKRPLLVELATIAEAQAAEATRAAASLGDPRLALDANHGLTALH